MTMSTSSAYTAFSGVTISSRIGTLCVLLREPLAFLAGVLDRADVEERLLRQIVVLALKNLAEAADRIRHLHVDAVEARELLRDQQRLRQETLDLARAR